MARRFNQDIAERWTFATGLAISTTTIFAAQAVNRTQSLPRNAKLHSRNAKT
jgi:hypothetical protein